jgi:hypothetical protein
LTPRLSAQPLTAAEQQQAIKYLGGLYQRDPSNPIFYQHSETTTNAQGQGASLKGSGDAAQIKDFNASAPTATLGKDGPGASGGDTRGSVSAISGLVVNPWFWLGLALLALGCYFEWFFKDPATGKKGNAHHALVCWAIGGCLIAWAAVPGWAWVLAGIGAAVLLGGYLYLSVTNPIAAAALNKSLATATAAAKGRFESLRAVAEGLENAPPDASLAVKNAIIAAADPGDLEHLAAARAEDYPRKPSI